MKITSNSQKAGFFSLRMDGLSDFFYQIFLSNIYIHIFFLDSKEIASAIVIKTSVEV